MKQNEIRFQTPLRGPKAREKSRGQIY